MSQKLSLVLKGFAMGMADIVPGVSGGTVAFITNIYDELLTAIASVNAAFVRQIFKLQFKNALAQIHFEFLAPLLTGIFSAVLLTSRLMHFLMTEYPVYTWSLFFGLILASALYIAKHIKRPSTKLVYLWLPAGALIGWLLVSLVPVQTPESYLYIFGSGAVAICAMILPGISGSFLLLIMGKYAFVTGALKNPFEANNLLVILVFCAGCLIGILSFSKLLNYLMHVHRNVMMFVLTGFILGSLKKIWPWKNIVEKTVIRGKEYALREENIMPRALDQETILAILIMFIGFFLVLGLEYISHNSRRGVSSAG